MKKIGLTIYALNVFHTGKYHFEKKHGHLTFIDMISAFSKQNAKQFDIDNHAENIFKVNSFEVECVKDEDGHIIFNAFTGVVKPENMELKPNSFTQNQKTDPQEDR